jgi:hypothetical protein
VNGDGGIRSGRLVWEVAGDQADAAQDEVSDGRTGWGLLFWVPLMSGGGEGKVIGRWRALADERVTDPAARSSLRVVATTFAELAGCLPAWERGLEGWDVTESPLVNRWIHAGVLANQRTNLLTVLEARFPGSVSPEVRETVQQNESLDLLEEWLIAAARVGTRDEFLAVLRR